VVRATSSEGFIIAVYQIKLTWMTNIFTLYISYSAVLSSSQSVINLHFLTPLSRPIQYRRHANHIMFSHVYLLTLHVSLMQRNVTRSSATAKGQCDRLC